MNYRFEKFVAIILLLVAMQAAWSREALAKAAPFSYDSVWFYRDGIQVVPEISKRWLTVVFDPRYAPKTSEFDPSGDAGDGFARKRARVILKSNANLSEFLHDPNLSANACFFRMRAGMKPKDIIQLINRLNQDRTVSYVHPAIVLNSGSFAFFDDFELEWKTGTSRAQRESLLRATHVKPDADDEKGKRHTVNVAAIPYFRALNLLAEDVRVLRVTPRLVEIKPSISAKLSLFMSGGSIGDSIPFNLTIDFSDRINIDPSSIAALNPRPPELQKDLFDCSFDPYDYAKAITKSPIVITGRMALYAPGEFTIPAVKVSYSCPSCPNNVNGTLRSIETEPVLYKVSSIIPEEKSENRLIVPTDPVAPDLHLGALRQQALRNLWITIGCFSGVVACAAGGFFICKKNGSQHDRQDDRKKDAQLAELLRALLNSEPAVPHWSYLGEVGALLREYLVIHYGIDPKYRGGSGSRFMETISAQVLPECLEPLSGIFSAMDTCIALETEQYQDIGRLRSEIMNVVDMIARNGMTRG